MGMMKEEAKEFIVQSVKDDVDIAKVADAIQALEQQPSEDCISRQAVRATYGFERYTGIDEAPYEYAESILKDLPSVTPSYNSIKSDLKPCEDWKFYYKHGYTQAKRDLLCEDCISREALLNSLKGFEILHNHDELRSNLIYGIMNLPSVTPQQRVGRWILEEVKDEDGRPYDIKYFCSECQAERPPIWDAYCGSCGARMEVNADDNT